MKKRVVKKAISIVLATALVITCLPTGASTTASAKTKTKAKAKAKIESVSITNVSSSTLVLKKKKTYTLKVGVKAKGKISKKVTFSSSNKKVVSVSSKGKLKALKNGTAKITVKSKANSKKKATITVKVGTPVTSVKANYKTYTGYAGKQFTLKATVAPKSATYKKVKFTTSNSKVAKVSSKGLVSLVAKGNAIITVAALDGSKKKATCVVIVKEVVKPTPEIPVVTGNDLSYAGYTEKWQDDFNGTSLNRDDWNVETHEAGWVNSELQEYVDSDENIKLQNGKLVIQPKKKVEGDKTTYTSGRINTKGKHDYTYGMFEVRAKVPSGQGYLPAFWMMPTDENLYGQWPKCGEIDAMEVMGQNAKKVYGTIHYGEPHSQSQGTYDLTSGDFSKQYHTYTCAWEPGKITWYVDGFKYHEESDWYSTKEGQGTVTYPAPFDQPFYMILNLAVGGSWVGNPDENTTYDDQSFSVDYVKVYQKDSYDENVTKPIKEVTLREPDANGNYVNNGAFSVAESLTDAKDWAFMTAQKGEGSAVIADNKITVNTTNAGTADYAIQLVQAGIPFEKGATYKVEFDAKSTEARTMRMDVKAPDFNYMAYKDTLTADLTNDWKTFSQEFKMAKASDGNGRLEFNMGAAGSTAPIEIKNVKITKTQEADPGEVDEKTVLADGNYIYNGSFQEGEGRLGDWTVAKPEGTTIGVTELADGRRLKVVNTNEDGQLDDVSLQQLDLAFVSGGAYALSFDAQADGENQIKVIVGGKEFTANLTADKQSYSFKIAKTDVLTDKNFKICLGKKGTIYLDNVRLVEDTMIKNGSFNAALAGFTWFVDGSADASCVVDSLSEQNALDVTVKNTSDQDWKIQMKQENVELVKDKYYKLSFKAKSSLARKIRVIMQGNEAHEWVAYSGENIVNLTNEYQTFEKTFKMAKDTDSTAFLSICLGKVDEQITTQHRICIDDIVLEEVEAPTVAPVESGTNILKNADFSNVEDAMADWIETIANWGDPKVAEATRTISGSTITYDIAKTGTEDWNVQLKQDNVNLEEGATYEVNFDMESSVARKVKNGVMSAKYETYGTEDTDLEAGVKKTVSYEFTMAKADDAATFFISMGKLAGVETPASVIKLSNIKLIKK